MSTYMGNAGNLMQHWTLCEVLSIANNHVDGLNYIDAHAMAPWATRCADAHGNPRQPAPIFLRVRDGMPDQGSVYEQAWHHLAGQHQQNGYPSSAAFVRQVWNGQYSLLLCETDRATANAIQQWIRPCQNFLFRGDWAVRFAQHLPNPDAVSLPPGSLTIVSFDPDMYNRHPRVRNPRHLYQGDLGTTVRALDWVGGAILIQLSTYSAQDDNPQEEVIASVNAALHVGGFTLADVVRVDGNMMSLVYARNVEWLAGLAGLSRRFDEWYGRVV